MKKIIASFLVCVTLFMLCVPVYAADAPGTILTPPRDYPVIDEPKAVSALLALCGYQLQPSIDATSYDILQSFCNTLFRSVQYNDNTDAKRITAAIAEIVGSSNGDSVTLSTTDLADLCVSFENFFAAEPSIIGDNHFALSVYNSTYFTRNDSANNGWTIPLYGNNDALIDNLQTSIGSGTFDFTKEIDATNLLPVQVHNSLLRWANQNNSVAFEFSLKRPAFSDGDTFERFAPFWISSDTGFTLRANGVASEPIHSLKSCFYLVNNGGGVRDPLFCAMYEPVEQAAHTFGFSPAAAWLDSFMRASEYSEGFLIPVGARDGSGYGTVVWLILLNENTNRWECSCCRYNWKYQTLDDIVPNNSNGGSYDNINLQTAHFSFPGARIDYDPERFGGEVTIFSPSSSMREKWLSVALTDEDVDVSLTASSSDPFLFYPSDMLDDSFQSTFSAYWNRSAIVMEGETPVNPDSGEHGWLRDMFPQIDNFFLNRIRVSVTDNVGAFEAIAGLIHCVPNDIINLQEACFAVIVFAGFVLTVLL